MQITTSILASLAALLVSGTPIDNNNSSPPRLTTTTVTAGSNPKIPSQVHNANHIVNALHSSMRQWGSAWNHNGMTFFLASVPAGTQFYHGTRFADPINGTEWLAFEPEHALNFARPPRDRLGKGPPPPPPPMMKEMVEDELQNVLDDFTAGEEDKWGYLHTYSAARDLRLLYIDGLSAGKTDMGTMDLEDSILLGVNITSSSNVDMMTMSPWEDSIDNEEALDEPNSGPPGDRERAARACEIAKNDWNDRIDGFLRAEAGFEIILCEFARDLDLVRISAVQQQDRRSGIFGANVYFYRSIASRFNEIGGERVKINYNHFVTAFSHEELDLFNGGKNEMPRLNHLSSEELDPLRDELTRLVMEYETTEESFNWQTIVDMIVTKYSNLLKHYASDEIDSLRSLQSDITSVFIAFIDVRQRDALAESERCAMQFIPAHVPRESSLAGKAVYDVSFSICSSLRSILDDTDIDVAKARINNLIDYLSWTTWKECKTKCGYNETCFIPIWPFGTVEDRLNPQCKNGTQGNQGGERYWRGGFGRRPPPTHEEL